MFRSLKTKIVIPIIGIALLVLLINTIIIAYVSDSTEELVDNFARDRLYASVQGVVAYFEAYEQKTRVAAQVMGQSSELIRRIHSGDRMSVVQYANEMQTFFGVNSIIVADADGIAIARSHVWNLYGDDISDVPSVAAALRGERTVMYVATPTIPFIMASTAPIYDDGVLIGGLVIAVDVGTYDFVDYIRGIFDVDITIFDGDFSVATTLVNPATGNRTSGTHVAAHVANAVLVEQRPLTLELNILGILPYIAHYLPLPGAGGVPSGMLFVGLPQAFALDAIDSQRTSLIIIGGIGILIVLLATVIVYFMVSRITNPIRKAVRALNEVSNGNLGVNLSATATKDEVGELTLGVIGLVDVVKSIMDDLSNAHNEYIKQGNIHYSIDDSKYQNSYKEIIGTVNSLLSSITTDIESIVEVLDPISDGDFNQSIDASVWVGDWVFIPNALNNLTANLKSVSNEVNSMIDAAAVKGDLSIQIDENKYNGDWRELMAGLNSITQAVNEPIQVIKMALEEMKAGNFDLDDVDAKISATGLDADVSSYKGVFKEMGIAMNTALEDIGSYINEIRDVLAKMATGDLRNSISREYVGSFGLIKQSVNNINNKLHNAMSEIYAASDHVLSGATQISAAAMDLANGSSQQAASVEELNTSIDVIKIQTKNNSTNAASASNLSVRSTESATEGNNAMQQMLEAMDGIKTSSNDISQIVKTIQDIAFQTNLLALNASVEAARAGEHGKGFAVVAEEVRNLAGRSQKAAEETTELIANSITRVETGSGIAEATAKALSVIVENADEVSKIINNISASSIEQEDAASQTSQGIVQIATVAQSNSASSQETAAAAEELNSQAEVLRQLVSFFKL